MGGDFQIAAFGDECHVALAYNLACVVLAGNFCLAFEDENHKMVIEVGFQDGFTFVERYIAYACDMAVVVIDQFSAVFVGYETVILHKILYGSKNIFENVIHYCLIRFGG